MRIDHRVDLCSVIGTTNYMHNHPSYLFRALLDRHTLGKSYVPNLPAPPIQIYRRRAAQNRQHLEAILANRTPVRLLRRQLDNERSELAHPNNAGD